MNGVEAIYFAEKFKNELALLKNIPTLTAINRMTDAHHIYKRHFLGKLSPNLKTHINKGGSMKNFLATVCSLAILAVWLLPAKNAMAIPAWARKYNADCSMCHTMFPQLNATGHKFRRLGYKMPDEFDSGDTHMKTEELSKFTNYFSARGRPRIAYSKTRGAVGDFDFQMHDVTLFYAGPVTRNVGFFFELPFEPAEGDGFLEVGQLNLNFGDSDSYFFMRLGQFHQFSRVGFGGLDRPVGLGNPSVIDTRINGFRPRHDGAGVETGYSFGNFTGLVQVTNGITAAGTGSVLNDEDPNQKKDVGVLLEYMIPEHNGSITGLFVYGDAPAPTSVTVIPAGLGLTGTVYNRAYLFADYTFDKIGLKPLIGGSVGFDNQYFTGTTLVTANNSRSWFAFLELDQKIKDDIYAVGRFDYFDPTNQAEDVNGTVRTWTGTGSLVWAWQKYLRTALEYQATDNSARNLGHSVTAELQFDF